jgi:ribosomal protein L11 methyltransferase
LASDDQPATAWLEIAVAADDEAIEAVAEVLRAHGQGIAIEEPFVQPRIDESPMRDPTRRPTVKTYIPDDEAAAEVQRSIEEALWHIGQMRHVEPLPTRRVAEEDWANAWKAYFPVVPLGERTVIVPAWRRHKRRENEILIRLDPGLAFGTGMHPTTRLCLVMGEQLVQPGMRVLDVGTGSGILSIAAARIGASRVLGIDIDPVAVSAARANVRLNHLSRIIQLREGGPDTLLPPGEPAATLHAPSASVNASAHQAPTAARVALTSVSALIPSGGFDLLFANITARVNAALAPTHARVLAPGGWIIASGILADSAELVLDAFKAVGLEPMEVRADGDWVGIAARSRQRGQPATQGV